MKDAEEVYKLFADKIKQSTGDDVTALHEMPDWFEEAWQTIAEEVFEDGRTVGYLEGYHDNYKD